MYRSIPIAAAFAIWVGAAQADSFVDSIVANLQDLGYDFIEVQNGVGQVKVEAIRGSEKLEVIYDRETGQILKQEREQAGADEAGRSGLEIQNRNRDFIGEDLEGEKNRHRHRNRSGHDDDDEDDDHSGHGSGGEDDDDNSGHGSGSDDDDNSGSGSSSSGSGSGGDDHDED